MTCMLLAGSIAWRIRRVGGAAVKIIRCMSSAFAASTKSIRGVTETRLSPGGGVSRQGGQYSLIWDSHWQMLLVSRMSPLSQFVMSMVLAGGADVVAVGLSRPRSVVSSESDGRLFSLLFEFSGCVCVKGLEECFMCAIFIIIRAADDEIETTLSVSGGSSFPYWESVVVGALTACPSAVSISILSEAGS